MLIKHPKLIAWSALVINVIVILQGAVVRATGSGAGCGRHWPRCNGEVFPMAHSLETAIEFSHRLLSLVALVAGALLLYLAFRLRRNNPGLFVFASAAFAFLIIEALLGAATVLFGLTADNVSTARGLMVAGHLLNSLLLVGTLTISLAYTYEGTPWPLRLRGQGMVATVLSIGLIGMLFLMFSGGIAAMGNTMFPVETLREGLIEDFNPEAHPLIRLRILHPMIAITVGVYLFLSLGLSWWLKPVMEAKRIAQALFVVYLLQLAVGTLNLALLAPIVLQILHLALAVVAFALLSTLTLFALGGEAVPRTQSRFSTLTKDVV